MRAVKLTLFDSGMDDEGVRNLLGRIAVEETNTGTQLEWNAELNKRRFELIDGDIAAEQVKTKRLIQQLDLNSPKLRKWRVMWMRIADLAKERDADLYQQLVGFPEDLPNLDRLRPPRNSRLSGIEISWYAKRQRGQLPETY